MVTPLRGCDELDLPVLGRLIEHILDAGVAGLFILGTTGEGPSLSYRLRRELVERACRQVRNRVPVLVGITDTAFIESADLARHAANAGADALVLAPPYYFTEGQPELQEYLEHLVAQLPLPLFLYNAPKNTKVQFDPGTLRRAMDMPKIVGLKDSSGNISYFHHAVGLLKHRPDWSLLIGPEELLQEGVFAGGHGGLPGGANVFPNLFVQLCEAARAGDVIRSGQLHAQVMEISHSLYKIGRHSSAIIKGIKCALACLGVCDDFMADPFHRFRAEERARVERCIRTLAEGVEKLVSNHHTARPARKPAQPRAAAKA